MCVVYILVKRTSRSSGFMRLSLSFVTTATSETDMCSSGQVSTELRGCHEKSENINTVLELLIVS